MKRHRRSHDTTLAFFVPATCHGLWLLIILSVIITCTGFEIYYPASTIKLAVPTSDKLLASLKKHPVAHFQIESINKSADLSSYVYELDSRDEIVNIDSHNGDISIGTNFFKLENTTTFMITARSSDKSKQLAATTIARTSLEIEPIFETSREKFCAQLDRICFYNSATYSIPEDKKELHFKPKKIGELGPYGYKYLCPQYEISYQLKNNSAYVMVKENVLYTNELFDHDSSRPGPSLDVSVGCLVRKSQNAVPTEVEKAIKITVLDRNDNRPTLQENEGEKIRFWMDDPHVSKGEPVGSKIIFLDQDSLPVNNRIVYEIHKDTLEFFKPDCNAYVADHRGLNSSVISCQLVIARDGILRRSPYCVVLEAHDDSVDTTDSKSAHIEICVETNLNLIHESERPTALALHAGPSVAESRRGRKKARKYVSSEEALASNESSQRAMKPIPIDYPRNVYVYRTASNLSRVAQPGRMIELVNRTIVNFKIEEDPTHSFNVTPLAGIVYVSNVTALRAAPETIYYLTISWGDGRTNIIIHLEDNRPANATCEELPMNRPTPSCSEVGLKKDCLHLCGVGTDGGSCQWRGNNNSGVTIYYTTCSPNLTYCPDNVCDPLEELGQKNEVFICPQDCTPSQDIFGIRTANSVDRGIYSAVGICTCDDFGKCTCAEHNTFTSIFKKPKRKAEMEKSMNKTTLQGNMLMAATSANNKTTFECGPSCIMLVIGCPTILMLLIIGLFISRRKYMKRAKRKSLGGGQHGADNEARNDMPLVSFDGEFKLESTINSKWEFSREHLLLDITLGEGEFGKVVKAFATNIANRPGITTVAVKMLKSGANSVEHLALLSEFQLLQEVSHPNVIKLLGACTKGESPLLIIEYAIYGSLRNYLRLSRKIECSGFEFTNGVEPITVKDILSFAWQICKGMAYLTEIKLVHRDLAARNVLLAEGKICKVSDFGLTRDVYEDDAYLKRSKDRVPVKWMAPESLADHVYTTKSDVWAFGILAWELITLGATPYPGVPPQNLYHLLKTGFRMERPENCSEEIYSIIRSCWTDDPATRPSFKYLASQWEKLLGNNARYLELEANAVSNPLYCQEETQEQEASPEDLGEPESLEHLWRSPQPSDIIEHSTSMEHCSANTCTTNTSNINSEEAAVPPGYDMPRPLIETRNVEQNLRYQNDLRFPLNIRSSRGSQQLDPNHYSVPKKGISYVDMTNTKNLIIDNLDNEDIEKKLSKDISFRFSSLLNLSDQQTSVV